MNKREVDLLFDYVKKRHDEVGLDWKTFDGSNFDNTLTYLENKKIISDRLDSILPKVIPKLKRDADTPKELIKSMQDEEFRRIEAQAKLKFEEQLEKISNTPSSVLLDELYFVPRQFIDMVIEKKSKGLLLYGEAGLGKSFNVKKRLIEHNLKEGIDFVLISGHITTLSLYKKLYYNQDKLIILDDINILESKINLNMLKASLGDGIVEYSSSALKDMPNQFQFNGRMIILLNDKPKNNEHLKAVESRILVYHLEMDYQTKMSVLFDIVKAEYDGMKLEERQMIVKWVKENTSEATKNLSIRLLFTLFEFFKHNKERWVVLAQSIIQNDEYTTLIIQNVGEKEFCQRTGLSRATYFNYKAQTFKRKV